MKNTRIALVQICPLPGEADGNARKILAFAQEAASAGAELVLFPECSLSGYSSDPDRDLSLSRDDAILRGIRERCRDLGIAVCFGYAERGPEGCFITQELTSDQGSVFYRKTHLGSREKAVFSAGSAFPLSPAPVSAAMQLCWESHIPEISTLERAQGAELLLFPYASPMSGEKCSENWAHLPARASDNGVFAAACNLLFSGLDGMRGGGMAVFDPKGRRIAAYFGSDERVLLCDIGGPLPRDSDDTDMHAISYFDRKRTELFRS